MPRTASEQHSHDQMVQQTVLIYLLQGFDGASNPGQEKNCNLDGRYPDVLAFDKGSRALRILAEVETDSTVTREHGQEQWIPYATSAYLRGAQFKLLVPRNQENNARSICWQLNINPVIEVY